MCCMCYFKNLCTAPVYYYCNNCQLKEKKTLQITVAIPALIADLHQSNSFWQQVLFLDMFCFVCAFTHLISILFLLLSVFLFLRFYPRLTISPSDPIFMSFVVIFFVHFVLLHIFLSFFFS